jgi:hypothetical protein
MFLTLGSVGFWWVFSMYLVGNNKYLLATLHITSLSLSLSHTHTHTHTHTFRAAHLYDLNPRITD